MSDNNQMVRLSVLSKKINIPIEKLYNILKSENQNIKFDPNQKLSSKQVEIIEKYIQNNEKNKDNKTTNENNIKFDESINFNFKITNYKTNIKKNEENNLKNDTSENNTTNTVFFNSFGFIDKDKLNNAKNKKTVENKKQNFDIKKKQNKESLKKKKSFDNDINSYEKGNFKEYINQNSNDKYSFKNKNSYIDKNIKKVNESKEGDNNQLKYPKKNITKTIDEIKLINKKYKQLKKNKIDKKIKEESKQHIVKDKSISITEYTTLETLSKLMNIAIEKLMETVNSYGLTLLRSQKLDNDIIQIIADEYGYNINLYTTKIEGENKNTDSNKNYKKRIPVVTVMGHVDHGKTTLLDYLRNSHVVNKEFGGITQHLNAYKIKTNKSNEMVVIDTPGHEAFINMRSLGCEISDVIIVIIAADDGVKEQTKEILNMIKNNGNHIVFAFNKIDKEGANVEKVKTELSKLNFLVEDWGGKYQCQEISSKTGKGVNDLLEKVLLEAEILDLKASFDTTASGTVIESTLLKGKGYVNTILVQNGVLNIGDYVIIGCFYGKIKAIIDDCNVNKKSAYPSDPVQIIGVNIPSKSGEKFIAVKNEKEAKDIVKNREDIIKEQKLKIVTNNTTEENKKDCINIIIKADVFGIAQAIADSLRNIKDELVDIKIIKYSIGQVTESDIDLAQTTKSLIITFNIKNPENIIKLAENKNVKLLSYNVIYDIIDNVKLMIKKIKNKNKIEKYVGKAEIKAIFEISKVGKIAGCVVLEGPIFKRNMIKIIRDGNEIFKGEIKCIKHKKTEMDSIKALGECGICIKQYENFKIGDFIEFYDLIDNE